LAAELTEKILLITYEELTNCWSRNTEHVFHSLGTARAAEQTRREIPVYI